MGESRPAAAASTAGGKLQIDPRYLSSGLITVILVFGQMYVGFLHDLSQLITAIAVALLADLVLGRVLTGKWINPASAYITGISCGILLRSLYLWPFAIASLLSVSCPNMSFATRDGTCGILPTWVSAWCSSRRPGSWPP